MKRFTTTVFSLLFAGIGFGQVSDYTSVIDAGTYTAHAGTQILGDVDDGVSPATNIGFTFFMDNQPFTQFVASSNGFIRLGNVAPGATLYNPLSTLTNTYSIAGVARDGRSSGGVQVETQGAAPNRVCVIQYTNYRLQHNSANDRVSFQIRLYETTNIIEIIYTVLASNTTTRASQIGLRGSAAVNDFNNYMGSVANWATLPNGTANNSVVNWGSNNNATRSRPSNGRIFRWTPPAYRATWVSINHGSNEWCVGETRNVEVTLTNTGNLPWISNMADGNRIAISYKWNGDPWYDTYVNRNPLPNDVAPGASVTVTVPVQSPNLINNTIGNNNLSFNLIRGETCWFTDNNGSCGPGNVQFPSGNILVHDIPTANAGTDIAMLCGSPVNLNGSGIILPIAQQLRLRVRAGNFGDSGGWQIERISDGVILNSGGPILTAWQEFDFNYSVPVRLRLTQVGTYCDNNVQWEVLCNGVSIGSGPQSNNYCSNPIVLDNISCFQTPSISYTWTPATGLSATNIANPTASPTSTQTYSLVVTANGCPSLPDDVVVTVTDLPAVPIVSVGENQICAPDMLEFTSEGMAPGGQVATFNNTAAATVGGSAFTGNLSNHTVEFWVNPNRTVVLHPESVLGISGDLGAPATEYNFAISPDHGGATTAGSGVSVGTNGIEVAQHGDGFFPVTLSYPTTITGWVHVAVVHIANVPHLYVNGSLVKVGVPSAQPTFTSSSTGYVYGYFGGSIDNIRVWNNSRTQAQIQADMNLRTPTNTAGLVSHLPLDGNGTALVGANATIGAGVTFADANYYTYVWSNGPALPGASTNEVQLSGSINTPGSHNYTVQATRAGCSSTPSVAVQVDVDMPTSNPVGITGAGAYCDGNTVNLAIDGGTLGSNTNWTWYAGSCASAPIGTGPSISVAAGSDTYFVNAPASPGCPATPCVSGVISTPTIAGTLSIDGETATCVVQENGWIQFVNSVSGRLLCSINSFGQNLGSVSATSYVQVAPFQVDACDDPQPQFNTAVLGRRWVITPAIQPAAPVRVRLYFHSNEYNALAPIANGNVNSFDNTLTFDDLSLSKYHNSVNPALVNSSPFDNCPSGVTTIYGSENGNLANALFSGFDANGLYTEYEIPNFSEFWLHGSSNDSPLPVTLTSFNANCEDNGVAISWSTASEQNTSHFDLERSRNGANWEKVATLQAAGTTNQAQYYNHLDVAFGGETVYYRLRQVDMDGAEEFYGPISSSCQSSNASLTVFPNPTLNSFTVQVYADGSIDNAQLAIVDYTGKAIIVNDIVLSNGVHTFNFQNTGLARGTYFIRIIENGGRFTPVKLIVQ